jgi:GcrA cell cycle regulator
MFATKPTWTADRIELLKNRWEAGSSCREIALEIGVSRNAVIGKISRLKLSSRARTGAGYSERQGGRMARRPRGASQRLILRTLHAHRPWPVEELPIHNGHRCTLMELTEQTCRWPINNPEAAGFWFCGNMPVEGLPYCAGHARIAYRPTSRT